ncbi:MAG: D-glycerate dehydrogenase [Gudongella sp.]|jgi:gluconate 2-dehydrogenase|nr:D-glycerate dehydrogenase [Gudongella sp.]
MSKPKVLIAYPVPQEVLDFVDEHCDMRVWDFSKPATPEYLGDALKDVEGIVNLGMIVNDELLDLAPNLKVISNITVGYNNYDLDALKRRGVIGTNSPGVLDETVADFVIALMLSTARRIPTLDSFVKAKKWTKADNSNLFGRDVNHATLGLIGMGRIGEKVAKRAKLGFDMDVYYYNRNRKEDVEKELGVVYKPMDELLAVSDFVVTMTPLTPETTHLLGEREFNLMKDGAYVINTSRGPVIDEKALIKALESGKLAGAGLDVYEMEPTSPDNPLLKMDNVVTTPHIAAGTHETFKNLGWTAARSMVEFLETGTSKNIVPELR